MWWKAIPAILIAAAPLAAQRPHAGDGYVFYGPGRMPGGGGFQQIGFGGQGFLYKGLAAGGELGYAFPNSGFTYGLGLLSANGSYHFNRSRRARLSPFGTVGYTLAFRGGHENLYNFGGGVTWWMADHVGLRLEVRDYVWPGYRPEHMPQFRAAVSFR